MYLAVFQEFARPDVLERIEAEGICDVDKATSPCTMAKSEEELATVRTNAKLMIVNRAVDTDERVETVLAKLCGLGFSITHRHPVTSAGCPMQDRVILSFPL
ncbi:hypothetical protein ERJ75_001443400 [Trypanosoma vivax]|uniref:Uncharacterized protein n=1 Tax=Trypanosoma vivax (strain Y486) TaxID=1055687 RepID=G0U867_TRYVY|nr:hypothetical protein TRVL_05039 [Trypanosoma vivax]KAH8607312.1 hypothetical protein ERJ75_001443400 [Trypanosoma vivax]CCC52076.1 conserved hypothetical protein [Trypanosoma vivax Y486]